MAETTTAAKTKMVFLGEEEKSGWSEGVIAERLEGEIECAVHVLSNMDSGPLCSVYLTPVEAAVLASQLLSVAREAGGDV